MSPSVHSEIPTLEQSFPTLTANNDSSGLVSSGQIIREWALPGFEMKLCGLSPSSYHLSDILRFRSHTVWQPTLSTMWEGTLLALLSVQTQNVLYGNTSVQPSRDFFFFLNKWKKDIGHDSGAVPPSISTQEQYCGKMIIYGHCLMYILYCFCDMQLLSYFILWAKMNFRDEILWLCIFQNPSLIAKIK